MKYEININGKEFKNDFKNLINIIVYGKNGELITGCNVYGCRSHGLETGYRVSHLPLSWQRVFPNSFVVCQKDIVDINLIYNNKIIPIVQKSIIKKDYKYALINFVTDLWETSNKNKYDEKFVFQNLDFNVMEKFMNYYQKYNKNKKHLF